jgi:hypothetical protein
VPREPWTLFPVPTTPSRSGPPRRTEPLPQGLGMPQPGTPRELGPPGPFFFPVAHRGVGYIQSSVWPNLGLGQSVPRLRGTQHLHFPRKWSSTHCCRAATTTIVSTEPFHPRNPEKRRPVPPTVVYIQSRVGLHNPYREFLQPGLRGGFGGVHPTKSESERAWPRSSALRRRRPHRDPGGPAARADWEIA